MAEGGRSQPRPLGDEKPQLNSVMFSFPRSTRNVIYRRDSPDCKYRKRPRVSFSFILRRLSGLLLKNAEEEDKGGGGVEGQRAPSVLFFINFNVLFCGFPSSSCAQFGRDNRTMTHTPPARRLREGRQTELTGLD